jgi:hypothetical protein
MFWAEVYRKNKTRFECPVHFLRKSYIFLDNQKGESASELLCYAYISLLVLL